jgi:hypothetical protein
MSFLNDGTKIVFLSDVAASRPHPNQIYGVGRTELTRSLISTTSEKGTLNGSCEQLLTSQPTLIHCSIQHINSEDPSDKAYYEPEEIAFV